MVSHTIESHSFVKGQCIEDGLFCCGAYRSLSLLHVEDRVGPSPHIARHHVHHKPWRKERGRGRERKRKRGRGRMAFGEPCNHISQFMIHNIDACIQFTCLHARVPGSSWSEFSSNFCSLMHRKPYLLRNLCRLCTTFNLDCKQTETKNNVA